MSWVLGPKDRTEALFAGHSGFSKKKKCKGQSLEKVLKNSTFKTKSRKIWYPCHIIEQTEKKNLLQVCNFAHHLHLHLHVMC